MKKVFITLLFAVGFLLASQKAYAIQYSLIPPTGDLTRGQTVQFVINIDTENSAVTTTQIGLTYDTTALQYVSAVPGTTMTSVSVSDLGGGKLLFSGTNAAGFTGTGVFTNINFKIIGPAQGSTQLCTLWAPSGTPQPTVPPNQPNQPTSLPVTGSGNNGFVIGLSGLLFLGISTGLYLISDQKLPKSAHHNKPKHHV